LSTFIQLACGPSTDYQDGECKPEVVLNLSIFHCVKLEPFNITDKELVLCNLLCILVNKYGKQSLKVLKSAVTDLYDVDTLAERKLVS